jgi:hypothetical protein
LEVLGVLGAVEEEDSVWGRDQDQARRADEEQSKRRASAEQEGDCGGLQAAPDLDHCRLARPARPHQTATISAMHHSRRPDA